MNILVIHEVSYRKKVVYEYQDFAERLASKGHSVSVIDFDATGDHLYKKESISRTKNGVVTLENTPYLNFPLIKYLSGRLNFRKLLLKKLQKKEVDVVLLYSVIISGTITVKLCREFNIPVIYRVLDIYHKIRRNYLMYWPLYFGEKFIYKNADVICVLNEKLIPYIKKMSDNKVRQIEVLHHGVDLSYFKRTEKDSMLVEKYGLTEKHKVILFLGTTYSFSGLDIFVANFYTLKKSLPDIKLFIVGSGDLDNKLRDLINKNSYTDDIVLTGVRPYAEVPQWLSIADICINTFLINDITKDIVPIKLVQYLACGKPVVCTKIPDVMRLFPERESGMIYCDIQETDSFMQKIIDIFSDKSFYEELSSKASEYVSLHFEMSKQIKKLESLLTKK